MLALLDAVMKSPLPASSASATCKSSAAPNKANKARAEDVLKAILAELVKIAGRQSRPRTERCKLSDGRL
jgi:hypothetical protein